MKPALETLKKTVNDMGKTDKDKQVSDLLTGFEQLENEGPSWRADAEKDDDLRKLLGEVEEASVVALTVVVTAHSPSVPSGILSREQVTTATDGVQVLMDIFEAAESALRNNDVLLQELEDAKLPVTLTEMVWGKRRAEKAEASF